MMSLWEIRWLEVAVAFPLVGAILSAFMRDSRRAFPFSITCTALAFAGCLIAWAGVYAVPAPSAPLGLLPSGMTKWHLTLDRFNGPIAVTTSLMYFLIVLVTARTKMQRFSFTWTLLAEAIQLAVFGATEPWVLIGLLTAGTIPPFVTLIRRNESTRAYCLHMGMFITLMISGWSLVEADATLTSAAAVLLFGAVLVRCGTFPVHSWVVDWCERASMGNALLFLVPLNGVYFAVRLVLPIAPDWVLSGIGIASLITALYSAAMSTIQREARRLFAYLFLSHASLVLVGLELHTTIALTGALSMWFSVTLALGGLGLTLRALEARFGRLHLHRYLGLYEQCPALAICFLILGLAVVGFPGTLGFVAGELLVDGAVGSNLAVGVVVVLAGALNGIAVVRAWFLIFTGTRHESSIGMNTTPRERVAAVVLMFLVVGGGLFPQPGIVSRYESARKILHERAQRLAVPEEDETAEQGEILE